MSAIPMVADEAAELAFIAANPVGTMFIRADLLPQPVTPPSGGGVPSAQVVPCSSSSFTISKNFNVGYQILGGVIVLDIPEIKGTSASQYFTIQGLPEICPATGIRLWPSVPKNIISGVAGTAGYTGSNSRTPGYAIVQPDGVIQVYCNLNGNTWPSVGGYMEFLAAVGFYFRG